MDEPGESGRPGAPGRPTFGLCHDFRQRAPFTLAYPRFYAECMAEIEQAEQLGYEVVWLSEHHFVDDGMLPASLTAAAAVAGRTRRIGIGTNILTLPLQHPLHVAEQAAVVDLVSGGRLVLGVGQGYAAHEFEVFGRDMRHRPSLTEEAIAIIRQAWDQGRIGYAGRRWNFPDLPFEPRPGRRIPIYLGATSEPAIERAVRLVDGLLIYCSKVRDTVDRCRVLGQVLEEQGRSRNDFGCVATGVLYVHEDGDLAWEEAAPAIAYQESQFAAWQAAPGEPRPKPIRPDALDPDDYLVGDPAGVADRLVELLRQAPVDQFAFWGRLPGHSHDQAVRAIRTFAERVAPAVRQRLAGTDAAAW